MITNTQAKHHLDQRHRKELFDKRGLDQNWSHVNCRSLNLDEASELLGYKALCDGIWLEGANLLGQFKPDVPWKGDEKGKAPKYRSGIGEYDAMLPNHPENPNYWDDLEALKVLCYVINGIACILITEGFFKAIAGCANGLPTLALLGVEMGLTPAQADPQGKRYLVPTLERLARAGFGFIFAFDADCATNKNVIDAQRKLAHQLKKFNVPQYSITNLWAVEEGKGMDDYIQKHGADKFRSEVLAQAQLVEQWEKQFETGDNGKPKPIPPSDVVGGQIANDYVERLIWNDQYKTWMEYQLEKPGAWTPVSDLYVESAIYIIIQAKGITGYNSTRYITNIAGTMRHQMYTRKWVEDPDLLPFTDGALNLKTGKFKEHSPDNRLTWCLPRAYNNDAVFPGWDKISDWLSESTQSSSEREILIHFAAAILRGRSDLQKFLHLIGGGGSGKSTYTRLIESLVGIQNCWNGSLESLEDKHEVARLIGKRAALFPDQDKVTGKVGNFKRMTGQDSLTGRQLFKDGIDFKFQGLAIVTSNFPIFQGIGSWLKRRILMVAFNNQPLKTRNLEAEFEPELSAFTKYLLSIPDSQITAVLKGKNNEMNPTLWSSAIRQDSIAAWLNDWVVVDDFAQVQIGCSRTEWEGKTYNPIDSTLFGSYTLYCRQSGLQAKGKNNFSADLIELCKQTLGWQVAYERCKVTGRRCVRGLKLRSMSDSSQTIDEILTTARQPDEKLTDNPEPLPNINSDNPDNLFIEICLEEKVIVEEEINFSATLTDDLAVSGCQAVRNEVQRDLIIENKPSDESSEELSENKLLAEPKIDWNMHIGKSVRYKSFQSTSWRLGILQSAEYINPKQFKAVVLCGDLQVCIWYEGNIRLCD